MRTGLRIWREVLILLLLVCSSKLIAQDVQEVDTFRTKPFDRFWTKPRFIPKVGVGAQDRGFIEVGVQLHEIYKHPLSLASRGPYCTVDIFIDEKNLLLGPKLGYEFTAGVFGVAADVTYFIDKNYNTQGDNRNAFVFTPKVGLTLLGFANLFYGYQIPISSERITTITRNRFSLVFNLNKDYFDLKGAPRK